MGVVVVVCRREIEGGVTLRPLKGAPPRHLDDSFSLLLLGLPRFLLRLHRAFLALG